MEPLSGQQKTRAVKFHIQDFIRQWKKLAIFSAKSLNIPNGSLTFILFTRNIGTFCCRNPAACLGNKVKLLRLCRISPTYFFFPFTKCSVNCQVILLHRQKWKQVEMYRAAAISMCSALHHLSLSLPQRLYSNHYFFPIYLILVGNSLDNKVRHYSMWRYKAIPVYTNSHQSVRQWFVLPILHHLKNARPEIVSDYFTLCNLLCISQRSYRLIMMSSRLLIYK